MITPAYPNNETEVMRSLIGCLMNPFSQPEPWQALTEQQRLEIRATYFLLDINSPHPQNTVDYFTRQILKRILAQLTRQTRQCQVEYEGRIRGHIHWASTLKHRYSEIQECPIYVCREVQRYYDTPENQLLKYLIERITHCIKLVPVFIRAGISYLPSYQSSPWQTIATRLTAIENVLNLCRKNIRLQQITLPKFINTTHIVKTENTDIEDYIKVTRLYKRYQLILESNDWQVISEIGGQILILPAQVNQNTQSWINLSAYCLKKHKSKSI